MVATLGGTAGLNAAVNFRGLRFPTRTTFLPAELQGTGVTLINKNDGGGLPGDHGGAPGVELTGR